jgi:RND family efflux transporter MFP subunit
MSDRLLIAGASVPMLCGVVGLLLLQRVPGASLGTVHASSHKGPPPTQVEAERKGWVGVVVAGNTAELAAETEGRVERVFVRTGARVKSGDSLLVFDRSESASAVGMANAQLGQRMSELARAQARAEAATNQLARLRAGQQWLSKQELDIASAEARMANAELASARSAVGIGRVQLGQQRLRADRQTLVAPFAGTVVALDVDPGDSVVPGQIVMRILSQDRQVRFAFPAGAMPGADSAPQLSIRLEGTDLTVDTSVAEVRPELDPSAQLVFASAALPSDLPEAARWIPGAPVFVTLTPPVQYAK